MIHAAVAKLNNYMYAEHFQVLMTQVQAAQAEGLTVFELDVLHITDIEKTDLILAFEVMGYDVVYDQDEETFQVTMV